MRYSLTLVITLLFLLCSGCEPDITAYEPPEPEIEVPSDQVRIVIPPVISDKTDKPIDAYAEALGENWGLISTQRGFDTLLVRRDTSFNIIVKAFGHEPDIHRVSLGQYAEETQRLDTRLIAKQAEQERQKMFPVALGCVESALVTELPATITLRDCGSSDADGEVIRGRWITPDKVVLLDPISKSEIFEITAPAIYRLVYQVQDDDGLWSDAMPTLIDAATAFQTPEQKGRALPVVHAWLTSEQPILELPYLATFKAEATNPTGAELGPIEWYATDGTETKRFATGTTAELRITHEGTYLFRAEVSTLEDDPRMSHPAYIPPTVRLQHVDTLIVGPDTIVVRQKPPVAVITLGAQKQKEVTINVGESILASCADSYAREPGASITDYLLRAPGSTTPVVEKVSSTLQYNTPGVYIASCRVEDSNGLQSGADFATIRVIDEVDPDPPLNVSCSADPSIAKVGETITWEAEASGGSGDYEYHWSGSVNGSSESERDSYSTPGVVTAFVRVTSGSQSAETSCSVTIEEEADPCPFPDDILPQTEAMQAVENGSVTIDIDTFEDENRATATIVNNTECKLPFAFSAYKVFSTQVTNSYLDQLLYDTEFGYQEPKTTRTTTLDDLACCILQLDVSYYKAEYGVPEVPMADYDERSPVYPGAYAFMNHEGGNYWNNVTGPFCTNRDTSDECIECANETVTDSYVLSGNKYVSSTRHTDILVEDIPITSCGEVVTIRFDAGYSGNQETQKFETYRPFVDINGNRVFGSVIPDPNIGEGSVDTFTWVPTTVSFPIETFHSAESFDFGVEHGCAFTSSPDCVSTNSVWFNDADDPSHNKQKVEVTYYPEK